MPPPWTVQLDQKMFFWYIDIFMLCNMAKSFFSAYEREAKMHQVAQNNFAKDYEVAAKHFCERLKVTTTNFAKDPRSKRPILRKILGQRDQFCERSWVKAIHFAKDPRSKPPILRKILPGSFAKPRSWEMTHLSKQWCWTFPSAGALQIHEPCQTALTIFSKPFPIVH